MEVFMKRKWFIFFGFITLGFLFGCPNGNDKVTATYVEVKTFVIPSHTMGTWLDQNADNVLACSLNIEVSTSQGITLEKNTGYRVTISGGSDSVLTNCWFKFGYDVYPNWLDTSDRCNAGNIAAGPFTKIFTVTTDSNVKIGTGKDAIDFGAYPPGINEPVLTNIIIKIEKEA
jgi:hypothetical protein